MKHTPKTPVVTAPDPLGYTPHDNYWRKDAVPVVQEPYWVRPVVKVDESFMLRHVTRLPNRVSRSGVAISHREPTWFDLLDGLCKLLFIKP